VIKYRADQIIADATQELHRVAWTDRVAAWLLERGADSQLVLQDEGCTVHFDERAGTASAKPGQSCRRTSPKADATIKYSEFSIHSTDGKSADAQGKSLSCTIYTELRVSPADV
jgi:hypothetical protein